MPPPPPDCRFLSLRRVTSSSVMPSRAAVLPMLEPTCPDGTRRSLCLRATETVMWSRSVKVTEEYRKRIFLSVSQQNRRP